jgi:hypothetical protein
MVLGAGGRAVKDSAFAVAVAPDLAAMTAAAIGGEGDILTSGGVEGQQLQSGFVGWGAAW